MFSYIFDKVLSVVKVFKDFTQTM